MPILTCVGAGGLARVINKRPTIPVQYLVVAGGGGNGRVTQTYFTGGGGAGGFRTGTSDVPSGLSLVITVGAGGGIGTSGSNSSIRPSDRVTMNIECMGGGRGGAAQDWYDNPENGGSGGGNAGPTDGPFGLFIPGGTGTAGQGNNGGGSFLTPAGARPQAGGGGAGGAGGNGIISPVVQNGAAGIGLVSALSGTPVTYATGGSGNNGGSGAAYTGNGGDAGVRSGGSGIVIMKIANTSVYTYTGNPTLTSSGDGYTIFTYVGSGTLTFI